MTESQVLRLLVDSDCQTDWRNNEGFTPAEFAFSFGVLKELEAVSLPLIEPSERGKSDSVVVHSRSSNTSRISATPAGRRERTAGPSGQHRPSKRSGLAWTRRCPSRSPLPTRLPSRPRTVSDSACRSRPVPNHPQIPTVTAGSLASALPFRRPRASAL